VPAVFWHLADIARGATIYLQQGSTMKGREKKDSFAKARSGIWTSWRYFGLVLIVLVILAFAAWYMAHVSVR
jgi:hypothetical protein